MKNNNKYRSKLLDEIIGEVSLAELQQTKDRMMLAARIDDLRKEKNWSKSQFAEKINKHPSEITKWLSGTHNLTQHTLTEIAFTFGKKIQDLFQEEEKTASPKMVYFVIHQGGNGSVSIDDYLGRQTKATTKYDIPNEKIIANG